MKYSAILLASGLTAAYALPTAQPATDLAVEKRTLGLLHKVLGSLGQYGHGSIPSSYGGSKPSGYSPPSSYSHGSSPPSSYGVPSGYGSGGGSSHGVPSGYGSNGGSSHSSGCPGCNGGGLPPTNGPFLRSANLTIR
ncbi:uncharacterized protein MYCGRDRAFT_107824 [Zymoseptoria tritici IPO323]|uniref:Uncharacterized protein n=1 Tax=Zymoseptoria tritici (strain CBS 115943 / IPO323) TaxID=336722 RepID=F9X2I7_ZYMTI|nr:uncharacterized protein MYCGRDRAFT_107824 [Zymoseptoria tritici IPO323]EGP90772.1 hypothetical protein MYCGRDRAFT_107824 [Zymoseptoria tritici IPO323]